MRIMFRLISTLFALVTFWPRITFTSLVTFLRLGPRTFYREKLKLPIIKFIYDTIQLYKARTRKGLHNIQEVLFRGSVVAFITSLLVWLSVFMYLAFYFAYVPAISHERPVHLQFRTCKDTKGICSFPSAHVQLTKRQQLLMFGQSYKVHLELEMPESPANRELGMFMVCADFRGKEGTLITSSCRSTMLHYRSTLINTIYTILFSPLFVFGNAEEKQFIHVELFSEYEERGVGFHLGTQWRNIPKTWPILSGSVTDVYIEIQSRYIQLYSAKFLINADFSGLRYIMFNWPILSAAIGITSNLFFIAVICMISWYQLIHSEEYKEYVELRERHPMFAPDSDSDSSSSNFEDSSILQELQEEKEQDPEDQQYIENLHSEMTDLT